MKDKKVTIVTNKQFTIVKNKKVTIVKNKKVIIVKNKKVTIVNYTGANWSKNMNDKQITVMNDKRLQT